MTAAQKIRESSRQRCGAATRSALLRPRRISKRELLEAGCDGLRGSGYEPFYFESILERDFYFAGLAERRAAGTRRDVRAGRCSRDCLRAGRLWRELSVAHARSGEDRSASEDFRGVQRSDHAADMVCGRRQFRYVSWADGRLRILRALMASIWLRGRAR